MFGHYEAVDLKGDFLFIRFIRDSKWKKNRKPHFEFGIGSTNKEFLKFDLVFEVCTTTWKIYAIWLA